MDGETKELPPESRNGQSTCNGEDFAKLIAARLENRNMDSQTDEASLSRPSVGPPQSDSQVNGDHGAPHESAKESSPSPEPATTHDMGRFTSFDEGKPCRSYTRAVDEKTFAERNYGKKGARTVLAADESKFIIRDTITGIAYDIRSQDTATMLNEVDQMLTKLPGQKAKKPWEEWWKEKREHNYDLMNAAEIGSMERAVDLLDEAKHGDLIADVNAKGLDDFTPLHFGASEGHPEMVKFLLGRGALVDSLTTSMRTPLHVACNRGNRPIIELLVNSGANLNAQERDGNTPAHLLSNGGWADALAWLLTKRPDISIKNAYGETAVEMAANVEIRQIFARSSKGADRDDTYSRTVIEGVILHDNRADMVKNFMFRAQLLEGQRPGDKPKSSAPAEAAKDPHAPAGSKFVSRRIRIMEWTKKLASAPAQKSGEEKKTASAPRDGKTEENEETAGPEDLEILCMLGSGSFGEVYLVKYKKTGKLYAMKVLNKKRVLSQNIMKYARTERNVLCYTKHPFIVGLNFAFQTSEKLFMVMDYCPGYIYPHSPPLEATWAT